MLIECQSARAILIGIRNYISIVKKQGYNIFDALSVAFEGSALIPFFSKS